jgi:hypothetical protein
LSRRNLASTITVLAWWQRFQFLRTERVEHLGGGHNPGS